MSIVAALHIERSRVAAYRHLGCYMLPFALVLAGHGGNGQAQQWAGQAEAGVQASHNSQPASVLRDSSKSLQRLLKFGGDYRDFKRVAARQGWKPISPQAADSCAAASDCEIDFRGPRKTQHLKIRIGSSHGQAIIDGWRFADDADAAGKTPGLLAEGDANP